MQEPSFPYDAWVLSPMMRVHKATVIGIAKGVPNHHKLADGRVLKRTELYSSQFRAIDAGHAILNENQKAIDRRQEKLDARRINLDKALEKYAGVHV